MGYSTQTDVQNICGAQSLIEWSNFTPGAVSVDAVRVALAIAVANATVDSVLGSGPYLVPVVGTPIDPPVIIVNIEATLAAFWLWDTRNLNKTKAVQAEQERKRDEAMGFLANIGLGRMPLQARFNTARSTAPRVQGWGTWR